ncbi:MAG: DUF2244 domain-containing protein [Burkholderiaceae bacterium]
MITIKVLCPLRWWRCNSQQQVCDDAAGELQSRVRSKRRVREGGAFMRVMRLGADSTEVEHEWLFKRNCALTPAQFGGALAFVGVWSLIIGSILAWRGAWLVLPFTFIEILALVAGFVLYARHACDYERLVVSRSRLRVEARLGPRLLCESADSPWLRVHYGGRAGDLLELEAGSQKRITLGRFVPHHRRAALARDLKRVFGGMPVT